MKLIKNRINQNIPNFYLSMAIKKFPNTQNPSKISVFFWSKL